MKLWRVLASWLVIFMVMIAILEAGLQLTDPLEVKVTRHANLILSFVDNERGYSLPPGEYVRQNGTITINRDLTRAVPDSNDNGPPLIFFGDSASFGVGVDDSDTFVNLLAQRLGANTLNAAFTGHNITYIQRAFDLYAEPDALLVWLIIENDSGIEHNFPEDLRGNLNVLGFKPLLFTYWLRARAVVDTPRDWVNFHQRMGAITNEYDNLILFAFDDEFGRSLAERYTVNLIPRHTSQISKSDSHPDVAGNIEIADSMYAILREKRGGLCRESDLQMCGNS